MSDDAAWAHEELLWLTQALRGHAEWAASCGASGLLPTTAEWLQTRREQYRQYQPDVLPSDADDVSFDEDGAEAPSVDAAPNEVPVVRGAESTVSPSSAEPAGVTPEREAGPAAIPRRELDPVVTLQPVSVADSRPQPVSTRQGTEPPRAAEPTTTAASASAAPKVTLPLIQLSGDAQQQLTQLQEQVRGCTACSLHESRTNTVFARGSGSSGVVFIGEGPGADEDAQGLPFVGKAGQLLDKMIAAMGLPREDVYVCNVVKCRPPNNRKPTPAEMSGCVGYLERQLELIQPRVIVALGGTAVEGLLGLSVGITRLRGNWRLYKGKIPVMPTFHPAYLLRQPNAKRQVWEDLQAVLGHLNLEVPKRRN